MQTTLLGLGIAIILAIVAALVAPFVVDWNHYRAAFEAEASRLTGLNVRVDGAIDARILPTPRVTLRDVEAGPAGRQPRFRADTIELEVALGPLLRGKVQASEMHVIAPQIEVGLDRSGAIDWPAPAPSFHAEAFSISHFSVSDGRIVLADAASASRLPLQKFSFNGDIQSFKGPFNGGGAFVTGNQPYSYRISGGRNDRDSGLQIRLAVDPSDRPLTTSFEGVVTIDHGRPQFDGAMALARPVGAALASGQRVISNPWQASSKLQVTPAGALVQNFALQYGPDDRPLNFTGGARLTFGAQPHLDGTISAMQLDVDRALADPDATHRPPLILVKNFLDAFVATAKLPMPADIGVGIDAMTVGGSAIESVHGTMHFGAVGWSLHDFQFHAPGSTQVTLSGQLGGTADGLAFSGPAALQSADVDTLLAWLQGRGDQPSGQAKTLNARGNVTIAGGRVAIDQFTAALDSDSVEGELAYSWAAAHRPAEFDAELRAASLDLDAMTAFGKTAADYGFELPHAGTLVLDIGKARSTGIDAQKIDARVKFDAGALQIEQLSIGDLGGAALDISGRIEDLSARPHGQITLDLDAAALDGLTGVVGKFDPQAAATLHRFADRLAPAKVHGVLTVAPDATAGSSAKLALNGQLGLVRLSLNGEADAAPAHLLQANVRLDSRLDADDGSALATLFGLDQVVALDQLPGTISLSATGPLDGDLHLNGQAAAGGVAATVQGTLRLHGEKAPTGDLQVQARAADLRPLVQAMTGQPGAAVPVSARAAVALVGGDLAFTQIAAQVGKASLQGKLKLGLASPSTVDGDIEASDVDAAQLSALLLGLPRAAPNSAATWSKQPLGAGAFTAMNGTMTFKLDRAAFTPTLTAHQLTGVARFHPSEIVFDDLKGDLAGGQVTADLAFHRNAGALDAQGRIALSGADAAALLGSASQGIGGKLTLNLQGGSFGTSPIELVRSLNGSGTLALADGRFAGLSVAAFDAATQTADRSTSMDAAKIQAAVSAALDNGSLAVPQANAVMTLAGGKVSIANATLPAQDGAELLLSGALDLSNAAVDARLTLLGHPAHPLISTAPELVVALDGPLAAPTRTLDISALKSWLALRAAELQARRLELVEAHQAAANVADPVIRPKSPPVRATPSGALVEIEPPANLSTATGAGARGLDRLHPPPALSASAPLAGQKLPSAPQPSAPQTAAPTKPSLLDLLFGAKN